MFRLAPNQDGETALIYATRHGHIEIVRLLLTNDADLEMRDSVSQIFNLFSLLLLF